MKSVWQFLIELNVHLLNEPLIPLPGVYSRGMEIDAHGRLAHECSQHLDV